MELKSLVESMECDALVVEKTSFPDLVSVSPYNSKTGNWIMGMTVLTSKEDVEASGLPTYSREETNHA